MARDIYVMSCNDSSKNNNSNHINCSDDKKK